MCTVLMLNQRPKDVQILNFLKKKNFLKTLFRLSWHFLHIFENFDQGCTSYIVESYSSKEMSIRFSTSFGQFLLIWSPWEKQQQEKKARNTISFPVKQKNILTLY